VKTTHFVARNQAINKDIYMTFLTLYVL